MFVLSINYINNAGVSLSIVHIKEVILLLEYSDYTDVFAEDQRLSFLKNTRVNHVIEVEENRKVLFNLIYKLSINKLRVLREYFKSNLRKGWIRKSILSAGAPILFISKKDRSLHLYIDYRGLNEITIKNRYPLSLISEILD
jgi:hypothetical protein